MCFFFLMLRRLPSSTLFPYTTLFRSDGVLGVGRAVGFIGRVEEDAPPREREAVVRLRHVEHHLVLPGDLDRKSTRLNSSHLGISYAVFCLKKKKTQSKST